MLFLNSEMRFISSVMLNASQDIHFIKDICNCSILHFRYINVSSFIQSFFDIKNFLDIQFCIWYILHNQVSICTRFSFTISKIHYRCVVSQQ